MRLWLQDVISQITGTNVIRTNSISVYSSDFLIIVLHLQLSGQLEQILKDVILDSSNMFEAIQSNNSNNHIVNSTITGKLILLELQIHLLMALVNSILLSNPERSKLLVNENNNSPQVIINTTLTTHNF
jgi:hypothetical protein